MMHEKPVLSFVHHRRVAMTQDEVQLVEWLRAKARDRSPDHCRGGPFWYLVSVRPGTEVSMAIRLLRDRQKAYCPREKVVEKLPRRNGKREVRRPMFPGYIFVQLAPGEPCWAGLLTYDGVNRLVPSSDRPSRMSEAAMAEIRRVARKRPHKKSKAPTLFVEGDRITIVNGPFASFAGRVVRPDNVKGRLAAEVEIFGRYVSVELELDQVEKL